MKDPTQEIDTLVEKLEAGKRGATQEDRDVLLAFINELKLRGNEYSDYRRVKLLRHCIIMAEQVGGLTDALTDRDAAEDIVRWINDTYDNEETNRDYRSALRVFGKTVGENESDPDDPPKSISWVPTGTSSTYDPSPEPSNMLLWDQDVLPMIEHTHNARDAAMIALAFDLGPRGGEFESLKVGDITDGDYGLRVTVRGKQGKRTATLVPSVPYVNRWLSDHPEPENPNAPLWSKLSRAESVSYQMLLQIFRDAAARSWDVDLDEQGIGALPKPVTLTNFRKSSAAHLASKGVNQAHLEDHHGWTRGSKVASRYVSVFAEEADREIAKAYGKAVEEQETDDISPRRCTRCEKETPRDKDLCVWCGQALEPGAAEVAHELEDILVSAIADSDDPERRSVYKSKYQEVRQDPEKRAEMVDRLVDELG